MIVLVYVIEDYLMQAVRSSWLNLSPVCCVNMIDSTSSCAAAACRWQEPCTTPGRKYVCVACHQYGFVLRARVIVTVG